MDLEGYEVELLKCIAALPDILSSRLRILFETHPEFYHRTRNDIRTPLDRLCNGQGFRAKYLISDFHFGARSDAGLQPGSEVFQRYGYGAKHIVKSFRNRAVYENVGTQDAIELISGSEHVHAVLLVPPGCT
jgi:hypothetical protein